MTQLLLISYQLPHTNTIPTVDTPYMTNIGIKSYIYNKKHYGSVFLCGPSRIRTYEG